jgi:hypothetical protein
VSIEPAYLDQGATFGSPDNRYRYLLWRTWDRALPTVLWVMLNPSTADAAQLDPTLRRVLGFSRAWGFGGFRVVNLFALRSTDPEALRRVPDPVGPENDHVLQVAAHKANSVIAGWGAHAAGVERAREVRRLLEPVCALHALRITKTGHPSHPLYLPAKLRPFVWRTRTDL